MVVKLIAAGVASIVVIALFGLMVFMSARTYRARPAPEASSALARSLNKSQAAARPAAFPMWTVIKATSAQHMMVVDVEAVRLDQARFIAAQIVEPVRTHGYDEILIYVYPVGKSRDTGGKTAVRRVQWTPRGGYVEAIY